MIADVTKKILVRHPDERGFFEELIRVTDPFFSEGFGQLSRSSMHEAVVKAWHIHKTQIDWWYVVKGTIKVALYDMRKESKSYKQTDELLLGENGEDAILKIPAGIAHGLKVIQGPAELVYITSGVYSQDEEGRIPYNDPSIGYDWVAGIPISNTHIT